MVCCSVAFYPKRKSARSPRVNNAQIDPETRYANLRHDFIPVRSDYSGDGFLEGTIGILSGDITGGDLARLCIVKELAEHASAAWSRIGAYISGGNRREHNA